MIFEELKLLKSSDDLETEGISIELLESEKVNLDNSKLYRNITILK